MHGNITILKRKNILTDNISVEVPYSKSISNRLLIIKFLAGDETENMNLSKADDTVMLENFLKQIKHKTNNTFHCKNAGTTTRFLIALLSITEGLWIVDADKRMQNRPILPLINILRQLGAEIQIANETKIFPIIIKGKKLCGNKHIKVETNLTSQIISALLLISAYIKGGITIDIPHNQLSMPYINMTVTLINQCNGHITKTGNTLICNESKYVLNKIPIEKDFSSACFIYLFVAVSKVKNVLIKSLKYSSLQGDITCVNFFSQLGVVTSFNEHGALLSYDEDSASKNQYLEFDLGNFSDIFPPLITACYLSGKATRLINLSGLSVKESDRLVNMTKELNKFGERIVIKKDTLIISPTMPFNQNKTAFCFQQTAFGKRETTFGECRTPFGGNETTFGKDLTTNNFNISFDSYNDHRIAMSLSACSLVCNEITIKNFDCIDKSFPDFATQMQPFFSVKKVKN